MNPRPPDLNLLLVFDALWRERGVTRAARRLGVSQPSLSEALARLRLMMADELFVRGPRGMAPTAKAAATAGPIAEALASIGSVLAQASPFVPATARRTFRIAANDYAEVVVLPPLIRRLRETAPGLDLRFKAAEPKRAFELLDAGEADFAIDVFPVSLPKRFHRLALLRERAVCLARAGHPGMVGGLTLERYIESPHVVRWLSGETRRGVVERVLAARGLKRRVVVSVTNVLALPGVIAATDLIATQPERVARRLAAMGGLELHEPPLALPDWSLDLIWGRGGDGDGGAGWLRGLIEQVCRSL